MPETAAPIPKRPLIAAAIALVIDPFMGMCFAGRGWLALAYLGIEVAIFSLTVFLAPDASLKNIPFIALRVIGCFHCYYCASKKPQQAKWFSRWWVLVLITVIPVMLAVGFRKYICEPIHLVNASMAPTVNSEDYVILDKTAYKSQSPQRGDVIAFLNNSEVKTQFIKRVIGLPGDRVQLKSGIVYINDVASTLKPMEDFDLHDTHGNRKAAQYSETLPDGTTHAIVLMSAAAADENTPVYQVPPEQYFVLGDNRNSSMDSRIGERARFVSRENISAKAAFIVFNYRTHQLLLTPVK